VLEHFVALYLDGRHRAIADAIVSIGTATASLVHPREVFQPAIAVGACALLIGHNHPSADLTPSAEDLEVTRRSLRETNPALFSNS
jgi:DNA repair protein RadC